MLSKRIHYGKFVAEAKFRESPAAYEDAIRAQVGPYRVLIFFFFYLASDWFSHVIFSLLLGKCGLAGQGSTDGIADI